MKRPFMGENKEPFGNLLPTGFTFNFDLFVHICLIMTTNAAFAPVLCILGLSKLPTL